MLDLSTLPHNNPDYEVEVRERRVERSAGSLDDEGKAILKLIASVRNVGAFEISKLTLELQPLDPAGNELPIVLSSFAETLADSTSFRNSPGRTQVSFAPGPKLASEERQVIVLRAHVPDASPEDLGEYRVVVVDVQ